MLRGINVSGQKLIKMDALKKMYEGMNFVDVRTYVQSGNVIFSTVESNPRELENKISKQIEIEFGFQVPVFVLTSEELRNIVEHNPFVEDKEKDTSFLHVTFLADQPKEFDKGAIEEKKQTGEELRFTKNAVYLYCPTGYGKTKLNNNFLESKLKVKATTRNWKTTIELLRIAEG